MDKPVLSVPGFDAVALLGSGGMGEVWKARQHGIDRWVALKILHPQFSKDDEYVRRFQREARTVGKLWHENIVRAFDCGEADGRSFLVMEFIEGEPLDRVLERRGALPEREALALVRAIARGLGYAWEHKIIHRDIKPQNILITPQGIPKVCDLGLSRDLTEQTKLTQTGAIACTPAYASPEQAQGEPGIDTQTDVYSLGVMLYQLVTGRLPFESPSAAALLVKHVNDKPAPPVSRNPAVTPGTNRLILDMIEKLPTRRPPGMGAVVSRIESILSGKAETPERTPRTALSRPRVAARGPAPQGPAIAVVGGLAAVVLVVLFVALSGSEPPPPKPPSPPPREPARAAAPVPPPPPAPVPEPKAPGVAPPAAPQPGPAPERAVIALRAAQTFCAANPHDLPAQIRQYEATLPELAGTPLFVQAERELQAIRRRREDDLVKVLRDLEAQTRDLAEKEEYRKAIWVWNEVPRKYADASWAKETESRVREIKQAAAARYPAIVRQAAEANRRGDAAAVEATRKRLLAWGMPGVTQGFERDIAVPAAVVPGPSPPPAPPHAPARPKLPAASEIRSQRDRVRGLFKADYAKKGVEDARALAAKLMEGARTTEDDPTRFAFLLEARDQAIRGGDPKLAFSAVDGIVLVFEVDPRKEWMEALRAAAAAVRDPGGAVTFVGACVDRARTAITADDYELSAEFLKAAEAAAPRAADAAAASSVLQAANDFKKARTAHRTAMPALEKLKADPNNAEANLEVGRFLCFIKGDWGRGLPHLERGSDKSLREAAARERQAESDAAKLASAADGWTKLAGARDHALDLFRQAWPGLTPDERNAARDPFLRASAHEGSVSDARPTGWYIDRGSRAELYRLDRGRSRSGRGSLRVDSGGAEGWMSVGPFDTLEGREYEFSGWILTDRTEPWTLCNVYFYSEPLPRGKILGGFHLLAPADQPWWTPLRVRCKAPAGSGVFYVMVTQGFPKGTAWIDDLSLRTLDGEKEFVVNGAFER